MTTIGAQALTRDSFAPFGKVLSKPEASSDAEGPGWQWWGEVMALPTDGRRWAFGYLNLDPAPMRIDWAERHLRSAEVVLAGGDIAVYVAPPTSTESPEPPAPEAFRVFALPAGSGVVMEPGVWHGAPFAMEDATSALVLLMEGTGREDVTVVRFPETPIVVEPRATRTDRIPTQVKG